MGTTIYHNQMPYKTDKDENIFTDPSNHFSEAGIVTDINEVKNGHWTFTHCSDRALGCRWSSRMFTTIYYNQIPYKTDKEEIVLTDWSNPYVGIVTDINQVKDGDWTYTHPTDWRWRWRWR